MTYRSRVLDRSVSRFATGLLCMGLLLYGVQVGTTRAELTAYEPFAYDGGDLLDRDGGIGFASDWLAYDGAPVLDNWLIADGSLSYPGLVTDGNHITSPVLFDDEWVGLSRDLDEETDEETTKYLSFLIRPEGEIGEGSFGGAFGVILSTFTGEGDLLVGKPAVGQRYVVETFFDEDIRSSNAPVVSGETSLIVIKAQLEAGPDTFTMYVNPTLGQPEPATGTVKSDLDIGTISTIAVAAAGAASIDELRWGDSFADVTPFDIAVAGDFDGDGQLTAADIDLLSAAARSGQNSPQFDLTADGQVDDTDRTFWVESLKRTWFGDANLDGSFDTTDLLAVFTVGEYQDQIVGNSGWADGDWSGDADFTTTDLLVAFQGGGFEAGPRQAQVAAVPEPSSLFSVLAALLTLVATTTRRR